jgi:quinol monooxygenase YgiN
VSTIELPVPEDVYVSITGLRLKAPWHAPRFWWHAIRSMVEARQAQGNISAETRSIQGVHHTISVWRSAADMKRYLAQPSHLAAMKVFHAIAAGSTFGYWTPSPPDWAETRRIWAEKGIAR